MYKIVPVDEAAKESFLAKHYFNSLQYEDKDSAEQMAEFLVKQGYGKFKAEEIKEEN